jgi:F-type H+-transporting ATPase subunit b
LKNQRRWTVASGVCSALALATPARAAGSLELLPDLWVLGLLVVIFVALIFPLNILIFRPIFGVLDERRERVAGARRRGEKLEREAADVLSRYREQIRQAREEAERDRRAQIDAARSEHAGIAAEARVQAEQQAERGRNQIASSLEEARRILRADG